MKLQTTFFFLKKTGRSPVGPRRVLYYSSGSNSFLSCNTHRKAIKIHWYIGRTRSRLTVNSLSPRQEKGLSQAKHHITWITKAQNQRYWESGQMWMTTSIQCSNERDFLFFICSVVNDNAGCCPIKQYHLPRHVFFFFLKKINVMMTWDDARRGEPTLPDMSEAWCQTAFRLPIDM